jgi:hypothetical protein
MDVARRFSLFATAGLLGIAVLLGWVTTRPPMSANAAAELARASAYFDSTIVLARSARPSGARGDQLAISLGLLEQLRLGVGSPFRLVAEALDDPRLDPAMRSRVAWALLARLRRGDAYVVDPVVLDGSGPWLADGHGATGEAHLELIERAIRTASDPRAGELAIRLAYLIAAAKGTVAGEAVGPATSVAALVRDRELASADLSDLLADAAQRHTEVLKVLADWREARAFRVEQPAMAPLTAAFRIEAMNTVPALVRALDTLDRVEPADPEARAASPVVGPRFAARLLQLGAARPPLAEVVVTLHGFPKSSLRATNQEMLAAAESWVAQGGDTAAGDSTHRAMALAVVSSAVAVRTLAQSVPWFPGDALDVTDPVDVTDLTSEFGLSRVAFERVVPSAWRPFYLRQLRDALRDMQDVFPALSVEGLAVEFSADDMRDSALSMHNPRSRALELSIMTSSGTLAHELTHDLDWQAARRLYAGGAGYSTDRAMRERRGPLASSVRGLAEAKMLRGIGGMNPMLPDRPAELFARGTDWLVATVLAQRGRSDGFLTAVQDASLTGYAAGPPSAIGAAGATSLVSAVDQIAYLPDSAGDGFAAQWADPDIVDPVLVVRRVLETPVNWRWAWPFHEPLARVELPSAPVCVATASPELIARERLLMLAADARARGAAMRRARYRPQSLHSLWAASVLGTPPSSPDEGEHIIGALRAGVLSGLSATLPDQGVLPLIPPIFRSSAASCASISR